MLSCTFSRSSLLAATWSTQSSVQEFQPELFHSGGFLSFKLVYWHCESLELGAGFLTVENIPCFLLWALSLSWCPKFVLIARGRKAVSAHLREFTENENLVEELSVTIPENCWHDFATRVSLLVKAVTFLFSSCCFFSFLWLLHFQTNFNPNSLSAHSLFPMAPLTSR